MLKHLIWMSIVDLSVVIRKSYYTFMHENLFSKIDINLDNVHLPRTDGTDLEKLAKEYNELLLQNQIDLQVLGIGSNGHIGFNEPGTSFDQETFVVELTQKLVKITKDFLIQLMKFQRMLLQWE